MRIKTLTVHARRLARCEQGYTMIFAVMVMFVSALLVTGGFVAAEGDIVQTHTTTAQRKAYYAARAGIQVYLYHLNSEPNYWTECTSASERRSEEHTSELQSLRHLPATKSTKCEAKKLATNIESADVTANGTFRVK